MGTDYITSFGAFIVIHWVTCFGSDGDLVFRGATFAILELMGSKTLGSEKPKLPPGKPGGIPRAFETLRSSAFRARAQTKSVLALERGLSSTITSTISLSRSTIS